MAQAASKTCDICERASRSHYCLECEQYFCENCKTIHKSQSISKNHLFQSSSDLISKCKDHNEGLSFFCNTCNLSVCRSCLTANHKKHEFSKLVDKISQLKEENENDLRGKVQESTQKVNIMKEGLNVFDANVEVVIKAITEEGTNIKAKVDKCIAEMIASVKDQSRKEKNKLTKQLADTEMDLKAGSVLIKNIYELEKTLNDEKLLQSLQKLADEIEKLTIQPIYEIPNVQHTAKSITDSDIQQLLRSFKIR